MQCEKCILAKMEPHPEYLWWKKCCICGFCTIDIAHLPEDKQRSILKDPLVRRPFIRKPASIVSKN